MTQAAPYEDDWDLAYSPESAQQPPTTPKPAAEATVRHVAHALPSLPQAVHGVDAKAETEGKAWDALPMPHSLRSKSFPAFMARSALFRATKAVGSFSVLTPVKAQKANIQVFGPKLDMRDKRIWEIAIELAKERAPNIGDKFEVELREFARRMGNESPNARALRSIWSDLTRIAMVRVAFELDDGRTQGAGSLIASAIREEDRFFLRLNPDFALPALLCDKQFVLNPTRRSSIGSALGQWLHDFYCTHSKVQPIHLDYLMELCGYEGVARNFPSKLKEAMDELVKTAPEVVASYAIHKPTRRFEKWQLEAQIGEEKRSYQQPSSMPQPRARRGGVAL